MALMGCGENGVEASVEEETDGVVQEAVVPLMVSDAPGLRDASGTACPRGGWHPAGHRRIVCDATRTSAG